MKRITDSTQQQVIYPYIPMWKLVWHVFKESLGLFIRKRREFDMYKVAREFIDKVTLKLKDTECFFKEVYADEDNLCIGAKTVIDTCRNINETGRYYMYWFGKIVGYYCVIPSVSDNIASTEQYMMPDIDVPLDGFPKMKTFNTKQDAVEYVSQNFKTVHGLAMMVDDLYRGQLDVPKSKTIISCRSQSE